MRYLFLFLLLPLVGCTNPPSNFMVDIDLQGHRGTRGLYPENTLPAFFAALDIGVKTLELDVVSDADGTVIVSHEAWMSATICSHPDGRPVSKEEQRSLNIFEMTYDEVSSFDCGLRGHEGFPYQQAVAATKPKLVDVIDVVNAYAVEHGIPAPVFNVEIKSSKENDGVYNLPPADFAQMVYDVLVEKNVLDMSTIQAFDARILEAMHDIDPDVRTGWLIGNEDGFAVNMARLSFLPDIYTPNHKYVDAELVASVHDAGMLLVPWTVNETERMRELIDLGVDGIITDYPDRGRQLLDNFFR